MTVLEGKRPRAGTRGWVFLLRCARNLVAIRRRVRAELIFSLFAHGVVRGGVARFPAAIIAYKRNTEARARGERRAADDPLLLH